jgi:hypothetical protein
LQIRPARVALATLILPAAVFAGQAMDICRDANGNAYFSDRGCPAGTERQGRDYVPSAQTYSGRESIDTRLLNNHEQRQRSGRTWEWRRVPNDAR